MNYYTLFVQNYKDGSETKKSLYTYDNETEAVARFHSSIGGYMGGDNIQSIMSTVTDGKGAQLKSEYWEAPVEETVEEPVEEAVEETTTEETTAE